MTTDENSTGVSPIVVVIGCLVLLVVAMVVIAITMGTLGAAIAFSLLAVLIGVAALIFAKVSRRS